MTRNDSVDADLGAAAASCAAWWIEEQGALTEELLSRRNARFAARLRGSLADLINSRVDDAEASECTLLVPVHQAWLPSLEAGRGLAGPRASEYGGAIMESSGISVSVETQTFRFIPLYSDFTSRGRFTSWRFQLAVHML